MADTEPDSTSEVTFKKRCRFVKGNVRNIRPAKRPKEPQNSDDSASDSSSDDETTVIRRQGSDQSSNPLVQSTSSFKKLRPNSGRVSSKNDEQDVDSDDDGLNLRYKSKRKVEPELPQDMGATAIRETETEKDRDAQAIFERARKLNEEMEAKQSAVDTEVDGGGGSLKEHYQGMNNYRQYTKKKDSALGNASSGLVRQGPVRAPENVRSTVRWDYQPDLCKDYKETGFCGFGDSCKFLHDRSDYKHGWQIELEVQKGTYNQQDDEDYEIKDEEELPFKCLMCRQRWTKCSSSAVVTKCKHYFCEKCALTHYRTTTKCYVCGAPTQGIFNPAKEIIQRVKSGAIEQDEEDSDQEEDKEIGEGEEEEEKGSNCEEDHHSKHQEEDSGDDDDDD